MDHRARDSALAKDLLESDRRYFEAAAELRPDGAAVIAHMPGFEGLAAGCVVHRVQLDLVPSDAAAWIDHLERHLRALGSSLARWYLDTSAPALERALLQHGYRKRVELGFLRDSETTATSTGGVSLRPVTSAGDWSAKLTLHRRCPRPPDGHDATAEMWVQMEQRKSQAGYMRPYLIEVNGEVSGAVSASRCATILRLKNLVVDPGHRRRRIATRVAQAFPSLAANEGAQAAGCFAIEGEPGEFVYRKAGYRLMTQQTEWVKEFGTDAR